MLLLPLVLACASEPPAAAPQPVPEPAPVQAPAAEDAPPAGRIGGEPILPRPVVLGAIGVDAVDAGLDPVRAAIEQCWSDELPAHPGLAGKVLVRFTIAQDGSVSGAETRSTSLRHPPTESCLEARVAEARFAPLQSGRTAIVSYPFVFPPA